MRLAVALAFADASIVVLALPEIVTRLHTSISHVPWVITAYNLALIATAAAVMPFARRLDSTRALIAGLALFGLASIGCGVANSMSALVPLRCLQGVGGGLLLCASLPMLASTARPGDSPLNGWSAAAAIGIAVGPAAGGVLTQIFDWRAIFLAQAPVAALGVILVLVVRPHPVNALPDEAGPACDGARSSHGQRGPGIALGWTDLRPVFRRAHADQRLAAVADRGRGSCEHDPARDRDRGTPCTQEFADHVGSGRRGCSWLWA